MRQILLVKTSSLGDVVHNLPVVADVCSALGDVAIDWVVERAFGQVPALHPQVRAVIPCEVRRWRLTWWQRDTRAQWRKFVEQLQARTYDAIIDTQGLFKSALLTRLGHGPCYGMDWKSSREPLAPFYDRVFRVPRDLHATERNRRLCALALGYEVDGPPLCMIRAQSLAADWLPPGPYLVFLHGTSRNDKLWPEERWIALGACIASWGARAVLVWGSEAERIRAERLSREIGNSVVAPRLSLGEVAGLLAGAQAAVGVDTGLAHLAAALDVPVVGIYGATDPAATGVCGLRALNVGARGRFPGIDEVTDALAHLAVDDALRYSASSRLPRNC